MSTEQSLLAEFRRTIRDVRYSCKALDIAVSDTSVTSAIAEITQGHLLVTVRGGDAPSLDFNLSDTRYDTVGKVHQALLRVKGYTVQADEDANLLHPSLDLEPFGPIDIRETGVPTWHHLFSDLELEDILRNAVTRHNPDFSLTNFSPQEYPFVLMLAHANVCRIQSYDAGKRKGLDSEAGSLLALSRELESQYQKDHSRLTNAITSPKEANPNLQGSGDIVTGMVYRKNLRSGFMTPISQVKEPAAPVLQVPSDFDVEDDNIRVIWQRNKDCEFYSTELWMDSRPQVVREREGSLIVANVPVAQITSADSLRDSARRQVTSRMVFRTFGPNSNASRSSFSTFVEEMGQLMHQFAVSKLEPESTYYFRIYHVNINYIAASSQIVSATTKPARCRFSSTNPFSRMSGVAGDSVTVNFDPAYGAFTALHTMRLEEKIVTATIVNPYQITFPVPSFVTKGNKVLVVESPTRLVDRHALLFSVS